MSLAMGAGPPYISVGLQRYRYYPLKGGGVMSTSSLIVVCFRHTCMYNSGFAYITCEVNGFVQIRAVRSRAGRTTTFGQVVG